MGQSVVAIVGGEGGGEGGCGEGGGEGSGLRGCAQSSLFTVRHVHEELSR